MCYTARILKGARRPFPENEVNLSHPLEDQKLHLVNNVTERGFSLLPFVRMMKVQETRIEACYFLNRTEHGEEGTKVKYVSYHHEEEPDRFFKVQELEGGVTELLEL